MTGYKTTNINTFKPKEIDRLKNSLTLEKMREFIKIKVIGFKKNQRSRQLKKPNKYQPINRKKVQLAKKDLR
jgi:hypothetical protein